jgi:Phosphotransferase enzyme family
LRASSPIVTIVDVGQSTKAMGVRAPYEVMPSAVSGWIERELGASVVSATTQYGGFSPGIAARLVTSGGRRAFVKAVGTSVNPGTPGLFRQEIGVMTHLPSLHCVPRLYSTYDDGDWVALLLEDIDGRQPDHPWTRPEVDRVFAAIGELSAALTPSPWADAPRLGDGDGILGSAWLELAAEPPADLDPWLLANLDRLTAALERLEAAVRGEYLAHFDIRADNILVTDAGRVVFVDWAWGRLAAPWVDLAVACVDLPLSGSEVDPDRLLASHPLSRDVDPDDITALIVAITGQLQAAMRRPDPPGLPTIRSYQRLAAEALASWVKRRTGW